MSFQIARHVSITKSCPTLCDPMDCSLPRLFCPVGFPGKDTEVGCQFFLQDVQKTENI